MSTEVPDMLTRINQVYATGMAEGALSERYTIINEFARLHNDNGLLPREKWILMAKFLSERSRNDDERNPVQNTSVAGSSNGPADSGANG